MVKQVKSRPTPTGLRISDELKAALAAAAEREGRTLHGHIVSVLEDSLRPSPVGDPRLSSVWSQEIGHLMGLLAGDFERVSDTAAEALASVKIAAPLLADRLLDSFRDAWGAAEVAEAERIVAEHARASAELLASRVRSGGKSRKRTGDALVDRMADDADRSVAMIQPSLGRPQTEMQQIRAALHLPSSNDHNGD